MSLDLTPAVVATHLAGFVVAKGASESPSHLLSSPLPDDNDDGEDRHLHRSSTLLFAIISPLIKQARGERQ